MNKTYAAALDDAMKQVRDNSLTYETLIAYIQKSNGVDYDLANQLMSELIRQNLIYSGEVNGILKLLFKGFDLLRQNGFTQIEINNDSGQTRSRLRDEMLDANSLRLTLWTRNLFWGTLAVAFGAIALVIWEIWKYSHCLCE
jgi:hypothetical protein